MSVNSDMFGSSWRFTGFDLNVEKSHFPGISRAELDGCSKMSCSTSDNVAGTLPVDPFGMDVKSPVTAIWSEDSDEDFGPGFTKSRTGEAEESIIHDGVFVGQDWFVDGTVRLQPQKGNFNVGSISNHRFNGFGADCGMIDGGFDSKSHEGNWVSCDRGKELQGGGGDPHDGLFFVLGYLGVKELLVVERVCRSLRDSVRGDSLLWRSVHVDQPLSDQITDEALAKLTCRAQGTLECLVLIGCFRITDNGLKVVLDSNPSLTKLSVPGCVRLTIDSILVNLRALKAAASFRIKHLRIGGLSGITESQFDELKVLLGADNQMQAREPHFYRVGELYLSCNDDRAIDIETCPRCEKPRLVYDCPAESCQESDRGKQSCRACSLCIARCIGCGRCINDCNYEETFYLDFQCLVCLKQLLSRREKAGVTRTSSSTHAVFHQEMRYEYGLYG